MASYEGNEIQKLASVTSSTAQYATFDGGIQSMIITTDQDIYINFDAHPVGSGTNQGFLIKGGVNGLQMFFGSQNIQKVYAIAVSTTANVYIMGIRGDLS